MRTTTQFALLLAFLATGAAANDWPQWRGENRDGVWHETGLIDRFAGPELDIAWRAPIANGYSGPTAAEGRVYVTDRVTEPAEMERLHCFDARTGAVLWVDTYACDYAGVGYPNGPRAAVTIHDGRAYSLGATGHLRCLDAATGKLLWQKAPGVDYEVDRPIWGVAAAPLVEGDLLIAQLGAKPDACLVAWDRRTGEERWRALEDPASYSAPVVVDQAGTRVVVCWTGSRLAGVKATTGALLWSAPTPPSRMIINIATPVLSGDKVYLSSFYDGSYLYQLQKDGPGIDLLWHQAGPNEGRTQALHALHSNPVIYQDHVYGLDTYGEFRCLDLATGDRLWEDQTLVRRERWATAHLVRNGDRFWIFNEQGELIIATLSPEGFNEISRARLIAPTTGQLDRNGGVCWSHPAFAGRRVYARNDVEIVCADLAATRE